MFFFAKFYQEFRRTYTSTFRSGGGNGKTNKSLERLGYYALFASVAETQILSNPMTNKPNIDYILSLSLAEVMSVVEYKKSSEEWKRHLD